MRCNRAINNGDEAGPSRVIKGDLDDEALMIAAIPNIIGWLAISLAKDTTFLYMGRLLEGFGVGIISYTLSVTTGMMLAYVLGMFVSWRMLALIDSGSISKQKDGNPFPRVKPKEIPHAPDSNFLDLLVYFIPKFTIAFCNHDCGTTWQLGIGLLVLQQLSGISAILSYAGSIFKAAGKLYNLVIKFPSVQYCSVIFNMRSSSGLTNSNLAACGLGAIMISSAGMTLSLLAVAVIFFLKDNVPQDSDMYYILSMVSLLAIVACVITFSFGMGAIPWVIMSEILPVSIKSLAGSFATLANWLTSFGITMTANLLLSWSAGGSHSSLFPQVELWTRGTDLTEIISVRLRSRQMTLYGGDMSLSCSVIFYGFRAGAAGRQLPL
ncbi:Sugar transporter ERD6-like 6 [Triticum urartu]|uniref:Sugar transporter ERD6-like 6 n=1 Tax=Triticum urartu TaxID=4572 RepID=M7Z5W5_TRIUA|nr:Sugar transporter ERD6-like 6 [Triticum urartu]